MLRLLFAVLGLSSLTGGLALAEKMSLTAHDSLIEKLESVLNPPLKDSMLEQSQLYLRLADLYAERARLLGLQKEGQGALLNKTKIDLDRTKSLGIYSRLLHNRTSFTVEKWGHIHLQIAHLYLIQNQEAKAISTYFRILNHKQNFDVQTISTANVQLGDLSFYKGDYKKAKIYFTNSLKESQGLLLSSNQVSLAQTTSARRTYATYRAAWCDFNLGQAQMAKQSLIQLLKNISTTSTKSLSFHEDVSRDLATFMATTDVIESEIELLENLSPQPAKQKNLIYLANELERIGKKKSALLVWKKVEKKNPLIEDRIAGQLRVTRIEYDLGRKDKLILELDKTIHLLQEPKSKELPESSENQKKLKSLLAEWAKAETQNPSLELIKANQLYVKAFPDYDISFWIGQTSLKRKNYLEAIQAFKDSATLLSSVPKNPRLSRLFEDALLGNIEASEKLKSHDLKLEAYSFYLELNPHGEKLHSVKYQMAHEYYDSNQLQKSLILFKEISLDKKAPYSLRDTSAELSIDSAVLLKDEVQIEKDALLFSQVFTKKSDYYLTIWRKSILNQSAKLLNDTSTSSSTLESLSLKLNALDLHSWPTADLKKTLQHQISLGVKLNDLDLILSSAQKLVKVPQLSLEEINSAFTQIAWVYELKMDFPMAIFYSRKMTPTTRNKADHFYKLALLSELAGVDPTKDYLQFIGSSKDLSKKQFAIYKIILISKDPKKVFSKYRNILRTNFSIYAAAGTFVFEKTKDDLFARNLLNFSKVKHTFEGQLLTHHLELQKMLQRQAHLRKIPISGSSGSTLKRNILAKVSGLSKMETQIQKLNPSKDFILQLFGLVYLAQENSKLATDILSLPFPKQLKPSQKKEFLAQVQQQVHPYQLKSISITEKTQNLFQDAISKNLFKDLFDLSQEEGKPGSLLAKNLVLHLQTSALAIGLKQDPFISFSLERQKIVNEANVSKKFLLKDPFNINELEKFRNLQKALGDGPLVAYLDSRLAITTPQGAK